MFSNIKAQFQSFGFINVHRKFNCGDATHFFIPFRFQKIFPCTGTGPEMISIYYEQILYPNCVAIVFP
jgi:hypothetical protein